MFAFIVPDNKKCSLYMYILYKHVDLVRHTHADFHEGCFEVVPVLKWQRMNNRLKCA